MVKKLFSKIKVKRARGGYTIIETMIAVSLFLVVVMAGMGGLLNANLIHQKSHNMRSIMDNLSFVMEEISRNLRTGSAYHCYVYGEPGGHNQITPVPLSALSAPKSCAKGEGISFEISGGNVSDYNDQVIYYYWDSAIWKMVGPYDSGNFATQATQLTPPEVRINPVSGFSVLGAEVPMGNQQQPLVIIKLIGTVTYKDVVTPFSLQTSVSQRLIDV